MSRDRSNFSDNQFIAKIRLLDDNEISHDFKKDTKGHVLLKFVVDQLDIFENDYFGLRYVDNNKQRHWLNGEKEISKQLKDTRQPYMFFFRVKFYPSDPTKLAEEITRYEIYLQLKRDILHGRLLCSFNNITDLAAHIVQAEIGDYEEKLGQSYLDGLKLLPRQSEKLDEKIMEYHKTLKGFNPAEAENRFLNLARSQDLYGVDPHPCKDSDDLPLYLGLTPKGIQIIREARRVSGFVWADVNKVSYENRIFYIQIVREKKRTNYAFRLNDTPSCKHLWKCTVDHMSFYSEEPKKAQSSKKSAFSPQNVFRKSKHKFSGKTEHQLTNERESILRRERKPANRKSSLPLSTAAINLKGVSMSNLPIAKPYMVNEDQNYNLSNDSQSETQSQNYEMDSLTEFEVGDFPNQFQSSHNSIEADSNSTTSSLENPIITNYETVETRNSYSQPASLSPIRNVKLSDSAMHEGGTIIKANERGKILERDVVDQSLLSNSKSSFEELVKNPLILLLLLAMILIPISITVQILLVKK